MNADKLQKPQPIPTGDDVEVWPMLDAVAYTGQVALESEPDSEAASMLCIECCALAAKVAALIGERE